MVMVRAVLVVDTKDFLNQHEWRIRQVPYFYYQNWINGKTKDSKLGSHWHFYLHGGSTFIDGGYFSVARIEQTRTIKDVVYSEWFMKKIEGFLSSLETVKLIGEKMRVKTIIITSGTRDWNDGIRKFAVELAQKVIWDKACEDADVIMELKDGVYGQYTVRKILGKYILIADEYLNRYGVLVDKYWVGDERLINELLAEVI